MGRTELFVYIIIALIIIYVSIKYWKKERNND